jgi:hypothetical protein
MLYILRTQYYYFFAEAVLSSKIYFYILFFHLSVLATMVFSSHTMWHLCVLGAIYVWFYHIIQYQKLLGDLGCTPYGML